MLNLAIVILTLGAVCWLIDRLTMDKPKKQKPAPPVEAEEDMDKFTRWELLGK